MRLAFRRPNLTHLQALARCDFGTCVLTRMPKQPICLRVDPSAKCHYFQVGRPIYIALRSTRVPSALVTGSAQKAPEGIIKNTSAGRFPLTFPFHSRPHDRTFSDRDSHRRPYALQHSRARSPQFLGTILDTTTCTPGPACSTSGA